MHGQMLTRALAHNAGPSHHWSVLARHATSSGADLEQSRWITFDHIGDHVDFAYIAFFPSLIDQTRCSRVHLVNKKPTLIVTL
jgi:hypothetical protein